MAEKSTGIPQDYDPFASLVTRAPTAADPFAPASPAPYSAMASDIGDLGIRDASQPGGNSIDELFGLGGSSSDPMAALDKVSPASGTMLPGGAGESVDPMAFFGGAEAPRGAGAAASNHTPEIYSAFTAPQSFAAPVVSTGDQQAMEAVLASVTPVKAAPPNTVRATQPIFVATQKMTAPSAASLQVNPASGTVMGQGQSANQAELVAAMMEGLGAEVVLDDGLTEEFMYRLGSLVRESVQGTIELLQARAASKREVKASSTVIMERNNNPLKFCPDSKVAMLYLLSGKLNPSFMPPMLAMRDAINDLKSHQVGVMAGTRAALEGVIARFEPEQLESRLSKKGVMDSIIPGARKAKLWDVYTQMYTEIAEEVSDDFHAIFGRAFLQAYEEQTELLKKNMT